MPGLHLRGVTKVYDHGLVALGRLASDGAQGLIHSLLGPSCAENRRRCD